MKRILAVTCLLMVAMSAWAGDYGKQASAQQLDAMKAEMNKCTVCKHMVPYLDQVGPIKTEVVQLNNGIAITHDVAAEKVDVFHEAGEKCSTAGAKAMEFNDEQAKTQLCALCQGIRSAVKSGATMSRGATKTGDIMVLNSTDSKVQMQLADLGEKCAMMMGQGHATR